MPDTNEEEFLFDYIDVVKASMDSYANIVEKLAEFQKKHEQDYEGLKNIMESPENIMELTEKIKEVDKDVFFKILEIMFTASSLDNKVRNVFFLTLDEKIELAQKLRDLSVTVEQFFKNIKKVVEKKEKEK